jgi:hypothetical protein
LRTSQKLCHSKASSNARQRGICFPPGETKKIPHPWARRFSRRKGRGQGIRSAAESWFQTRPHVLRAHSASLDSNFLGFFWLRVESSNCRAVPSRATDLLEVDKASIDSAEVLRLVEWNPRCCRAPDSCRTKPTLAKAKGVSDQTSRDHTGLCRCRIQNIGTTPSQIFGHMPSTSYSFDSCLGRLQITRCFTSPVPANPAPPRDTIGIVQPKQRRQFVLIEFIHSAAFT